MKLLAIESSAMVASVALATEESIVAEYTVNNKKTHSQTLLPMIDEIIQSIGWNINELDYIAVTNGPGSFTGLRIGAATAKGIAQAIDKPIVAIPSLEALAMNGISHSGLIVSIMDARRNNVFAGIYKSVNNKLQEVCKMQALEIAQLIEMLNDFNEEVLFIGDAIKVHKERIAKDMRISYKFAPVFMREYKASSLVECACGHIEQGQYVNSGDLELEYLRKSQAERELEAKKKEV